MDTSREREIERYLGGAIQPVMSGRSERRVRKDIVRSSERNARVSVRDQANHELHKEKARRTVSTAHHDATLIGYLGDQIRENVNGDEYQARLQAGFLNDAVEAVRSDFRRTIGLPS